MSKQSKNEQAGKEPELVPTVDKTPRSLVSGGKFHDFDQDPTFEGIYKHPVVAEQDNEKRQQKKGDVIGYAFDTEGDEEEIVGNSHSVRKAIDQVEPGARMRIEFLGKGETSTGQPFNRFKIDLLGYVGE